MRIKIVTFILLAAFLPFSSFAFTPVQNNINEFNQSTYTIKDIFAATSTVDNPVSVYMSLSAVKVSSVRYDYVLSVRYENDQKIMLNIPKGETLSFLIDGKKMNIDGAGSINHRKYLVWHINNTEEADSLNALSTKEKETARASEKAQYIISHDILEQMADAKEVKMKIRGENKSLIYTIPQDTLIDIKRFMAQY